MLDWTDRHCRFFMRLLSKRALLYTEMITTGALIHGDQSRFLQHNPQEHPVALQLGGSDPKELAICTKLAIEHGYDEVNLNVGCPSDRVQNNKIGACLMAMPNKVAHAISAMKDVAGSTPITVKHRIGIDGYESYAHLVDFVGKIAEAGCNVFIVHARIAILAGLSPKQNRDIPPLRYDIVEQLTHDFPHLQFILNGGIKDLAECRQHLTTFDGVMLGRAAYHDSYLLAEVDQQLFGDTTPIITRLEVLQNMRDYILEHVESGGKVTHITKHMLGLVHQCKGARLFRQLLSSDIHQAKNPLDVYDQAVDLLDQYE
ncbi:UNVERIFIED_CONTAM: hypothetical protein GTU68_027858 [Idotea baltica]|nr:hypothetical protein [Idotea baltica]